MTLSLSVLVPYRPDGGWRDRAWESVVSPFWSRIVDEWPGDAELLIESPPPSGPGSPADFNHPLAINRAARRARGTLLAIADADCLPDASYVRLAERAMREGGVQWTLPRFYRKLTQEATEGMLAYAARPYAAGGWLIADDACSWIGDSVSWAGCPIIPALAFADVGGYDERIAWWGADDICMGVSMTTLYGDALRLEGVTHLWHPEPPEHNYAHARHAAQMLLVDRYIAAAGDPLRIREVRDGS